MNAICEKQEKKDRGINCLIDRTIHQKVSRIAGARNLKLSELMNQILGEYTERYEVIIKENK